MEIKFENDFNKIKEQIIDLDRKKTDIWCASHTKDLKSVVSGRAGRKFDRGMKKMAKNKKNPARMETSTKSTTPIVRRETSYTQSDLDKALEMFVDQHIQYVSGKRKTPASGRKCATMCLIPKSCFAR